MVDYMVIRESLEGQNNAQQLVLPPAPKFRLFYEYLQHTRRPYSSLLRANASLYTLLENMSFGKASIGLHEAKLCISFTFLFLPDRQETIGLIFQSLLKSVILVVWKTH